MQTVFSFFKFFLGPQTILSLGPLLYTGDIFYKIFTSLTYLYKLHQGHYINTFIIHKYCNKCPYR